MIRARLKKRLDSADGPLQLDAELALAEGELAALSGRSGAGKTTLLRMLAGLTPPDEGRVEVRGEVWYDSAAGVDWPARRRRAGLVFQDYALFPNMTVEENLRFALLPGSDARAVGELLELVELAALKDRLPARLSGGQKQRVALARALVQKPAVLLLDEPLSALDPETRARLQSEVRALHARYGSTTLLVSHDRAEVARLAGRTLTLENGRLSQSP